MDVAHQQLCTAIELWFNNKYPVSTYTLAYAAHEIIHYYGKKSGKTKRTLIFDSDKKKLITRLEKAAHFFKHANKDHDKTFEFDPGLTMGILVFSIFGLLEIVNEMEDLEALEYAFVNWIYLYDPEWLGEAALEFSKKTWGSEMPQEVRKYFTKLNKYEFMQYSLKKWNDHKNKDLS